MDSSAMPQSGFGLGQNFLFGSAAGCQAVQRPNIVTISKRFKRYMDPNLLTKNSPIKLNYRMVYAEHQSPYQIQVEFELNKVNKLNTFAIFNPSTFLIKMLNFFSFLDYYFFSFFILANASHRFVFTKIMFK